VVQPQITLPALSILIAGPLCGIWARGVTLEQLRTIEVKPAAVNDYDVFISYARDELQWVDKNLYLPLRDATLPNGRKLQIFFDRDAIQVSSTWQDKIALSIDGSRFIVAVYSEVYFTRPYCIYELRRAHRKRIVGGGESDYVFPLMLGRPKIPAAFDDIQASAVDDKPDAPKAVIERIIAILSHAHSD